jgi:hypothetical protein
VFVSYPFNDANKWGIRHSLALDFEVVLGRHMDGDSLVETINDRQCRMHRFGKNCRPERLIR